MIKTESRYEVEGKVVDAKSPEHAARFVCGKLTEGATVTVLEWTGKVTTFVAGRKGRLVEIEKLS